MQVGAIYKILLYAFGYDQINKFLFELKFIHSHILTYQNMVLFNANNEIWYRWMRTQGKKKIVIPNALTLPSFRLCRIFKSIFNEEKYALPFCMLFNRL